MFVLAPVGRQVFVLAAVAPQALHVPLLPGLLPFPPPVFVVLALLVVRLLRLLPLRLPISRLQILRPGLLLLPTRRRVSRRRNVVG